MSFSTSSKSNKATIAFCVLILLLATIFIFYLVRRWYDNRYKKVFGKNRAVIWGVLIFMTVILFFMVLTLLIMEVKVMKEKDPYQKDKLQVGAKKMRIACFSYFGVLIMVVLVYFYSVKKNETSTTSPIAETSPSTDKIAETSPSTDQIIETDGNMEIDQGKGSIITVAVKGIDDNKKIKKTPYYLMLTHNVNGEDKDMLIINNVSIPKDAIINLTKDASGVDVVEIISTDGAKTLFRLKEDRSWYQKVDASNETRSDVSASIPGSVQIPNNSGKVPESESTFYTQRVPTNRGNYMYIGNVALTTKTNTAPSATLVTSNDVKKLVEQDGDNYNVIYTDANGNKKILHKILPEDLAKNITSINMYHDPDVIKLSFLKNLEIKTIQLTPQENPSV